MKLKIITLVSLLSLFNLVFATETGHHLHPQATATDKAVPSVKAQYAGYCEIEIINNSYDDVRVSGVFDDGYPLDSFSIYSYEAPHYISLFYYGYCHYGMNLYIDSYYGYNLYSAYTTRGTTVYLYPYLKEKAKVSVLKK